MTFAAGADVADIRKRGRETQTLVFVVFAIAAVGVVAEIVVSPLLKLAHGDGFAITDLRDRLIEALPMLILLSGLWSAQRVFGRVAEGDIFTAANAAGVGDIGQAMGWCGFAVVVLVPSIKAWVLHEGVFDLRLEGWALMLAALGGVVVLFGRIWALAVEIKADADQII